jgi:adenosylhomocysteine nucleosidase
LIACLAALPAELNGLRRRMTVRESSHRKGMTLHSGRYGHTEVLLVQTGMGRKAVERAAAFALDRYEPPALISFGFAGGLSPCLQAGDLVLCRRLYPEAGGANLPEVCSDEAMLAAAQASRSAGKAPIVGNCLTTGRVVGMATEKRALAERYQADILEMESYWAGLLCATRGVPFLAVRAISDEASADLPFLEHVVSPTGRMRWAAPAAYLLAHPSALHGLPRLAAGSRRAERQLTGFLCDFLSFWRAVC